MTKLILKNWRNRIQRAVKRGNFTQHDIDMSYDWSKCAIGERDCFFEVASVYSANNLFAFAILSVLLC